MRKFTIGFTVKTVVFSLFFSLFSMAGQLQAATSLNPKTSNMTAVPQGASASKNAMTAPSMNPYVPTTATPDYFGTTDPVSGYATGNFGNSPLPVSVIIQGTGSGALYVASYDSTGKITKFDVVNQGVGYDNTTFVSVIGGGGYGATGAATVDPVTGAITKITLVNPGSGYGTAKGIRKFVTDLPTLPAATPQKLPAVNAPGAGYKANQPSIAASDYYEIAAVRTKWQFSVDMPYTAVNMYVQIDPARAGPNCGAGETALTYPGGAPINNLAGQQVCAINSNKDFGSTSPSAVSPQSPFSYLGPVIVAQQNVPSRITYDNYLPTGNKQCTDQTGATTSSMTCGGDLFLPVDSSIMGAGSGPNGGFYSTNRTTIHLHGGITPWISDGTMNQWVSPVNANEQYPAGVSVRYVPDMWYDAHGAWIPSCYGLLTCTAAVAGNTFTAPFSTNPGRGRMTFYYTNQDTARLMFYHDHSAGITRLNVYSGLAAGYLLHDALEGQVLVAAGVRSAANTVNTALEQTLIFQDKTFVPDQSQLLLQDPTWNTTAWGDTGSLWFPHVYQPNQNPALTPANSSSPGANQTGRWDYGPWFWPAVTSEMHAPVKNPLCNPACPVGTNYAQYSQNPGTPNVSAVPEAFSDVMTVNGVTYPVAHLAQHVYRFQVLNASNDRTLNLSLYYAKSTKNYMSAPSPLNGTAYPYHSNDYANMNCVPGTNGIINMWSNASTDTTPACADSGEVSMVPAKQGQPGTQGLKFPDQFQDHAAGVQDMYMKGPDLVQIGTEGGMVPASVINAANPIGFEYVRQSIVTTNVSSHSLILGPAQRADILVDLTQVPSGSTLILYNDAPAPFPGFDPRFDYYTGDTDQTLFGGAPTTLPGYAPNTRTMMQIQVLSDGQVTAPLNIAAVNTALQSIYASSRQAPVVPQQAYDAAFGTTTTNIYPGLNDSTTTVKSTGVASIALNPATLGTHTITADNFPQVTITGGDGNGAKAVPIVQDSGGIVSVDPVTATYTSNNLPTVTVDAPPAGAGARTATVVPTVAGTDRVNAISVVNPGARYTSAPAVTIVGGSQTSAVAIAHLTPTSINTIKVDSAGTYNSSPTVTLTGGGVANGSQQAVAVLKPVGLSGIQVASSQNYLVPPTLTISKAAGDTASGGGTAVAYLATSVASVTVTNAGTCTTANTNPDVAYFSITFTGGSTAPVTVPIAFAHARFNGSSVSLRSVDLLTNGSGYQTVPTATVVLNGGISCSVQPTVNVSLTPGPIATIAITNPGVYSLTPVVTDGTVSDSFTPLLRTTQIASVNLVGTTVNTFTDAPTVIFSTGNAIATAVLNETTVSNIQVLDTGSGYISTISILIDPPAADPTCAVVSDCATARVSAGTGLLGLKVLDPGAGYTTDPTVTISGGGAATITSVARRGSGQLTSIIVTNPGTGYLKAPTVNIFYPVENVTDSTSGIASLATQTAIMNYQPKGIHELFELDYGRMDAVMSSEVPITNFTNQTTIPWTSIDPPTEIVDTNAFDFDINGGLSGNQIDTLPDGTQIWRYTHNGVDTHFIHFHMFNVQVVARLGWDGVNQPLAAYDIGWRDTIQFDPLTIMFIAIKPIVPIVPWQLPNSIRPLSPSDPLGQVAPMMSGFDPSGAAVANQTNVLTNFGWEYMVHCHLLGHEENDMMRTMAVGLDIAAPTALSAVLTGGKVRVTWKDNSINETGFRLQRYDVATASWIYVGSAANHAASTWNVLTQSVNDPGLTTGDTTGYITDPTTLAPGTYMYRVIAIDLIGTPNQGSFQTVESKSDPSNIVYVTI